MGFDFEIRYKKGKENSATNALSRINGTELMVIAILSVSSDLMQEIQQSWEHDPYLSQLILKLQQQLVDKSPYAWFDEQLTRRGRLVMGNDAQLQAKIIKLFHERGLGGHSGVQATIKRLNTLYFWKGMDAHVRKTVQRCDTCQRFKYDNAASPGLLQPLSLPSQTWSQVTIDFIDGLPNFEGYEVVLW